MKFLVSDVFFRTITKWIRDGWELRTVYNNSSIDQFFLAKDGIQETFVLFYNQTMYNKSDLIAAAEQKDKTMAEQIVLKSTTPNWADFGAFKGGAVIMYEGQKYLCLAPHKRLENKPPHMHPAWAIVHASKHEGVQGMGCFRSSSIPSACIWTQRFRYSRGF